MPTCWRATKREILPPHALGEGLGGTRIVLAGVLRAHRGVQRLVLRRRHRPGLHLPGTARACLPEKPQSPCQLCTCNFGAAVPTAGTAQFFFGPHYTLLHLTTLNIPPPDPRLTPAWEIGGGDKIGGGDLLAPYYSSL